MNKKEFLKIIKKYREGDASKEEKKLVEVYYDLLGLQEVEDEKIAGKTYENQLLDKLWERIYEKERGERTKPKKLVYYRRVAAVVIILLATGLGFYGLNGRQQEKPVAINVSANQSSLPVVITPGGKKAVLTLGNGQKVSLGSGTAKMIVGVAKQDSGQLVYGSGHGKASGTVQYNTLTTPQGGEFKVELSDGTKVWLNAESALRYPIAFPEKERKVSVKGEAYFEVAHQKDHPFIVEAGDAEVQVLGTHFNINAYQTQGDIKTTLAEGHIRVVKDNKSQLLSPGEQALVTRENKNIEVKQINLDKVLAWKHNLFYFQNTNIKKIMSELARWYNVEVVYQVKDYENLNFSGIISRYADIEAVLERMSLTGTIRFAIEGRTVIVKG